MKVTFPWKGHLKRHQHLDWTAEPYEIQDGIFQPTGSVTFERAGTYLIEWSQETGLRIKQVTP